MHTTTNTAGHFRESDSGRRFEDAFQVIVTEEGRREIDDAMRDIAKNPYLDGEPGVLLDQVRAELERIYEGIEGSTTTRCAPRTRR